MKKASLRMVQSEIVETVGLSDICHTCDVTAEWIIDLVEHGILDPVEPAELEWRFHGTSLSRAGAALRLSRDLGINLSGVALILDLLEERDDLVRRLRRYETGDAQGD